VAAVAVLALVLAAGFIFVTKSKNDDFTIPGLTLTASNEPGIDPFTKPTNVAQRTSLDNVRLSAQVGAPKDGTRQVNGTQPGLYARGGPTCDTNALARNLSADPKAAAAWAGVFGIKPSSIPHYLNTLSSVSLTADTWVTDHTYQDGGARPHQAVLQNGTSVLIDGAGVPRVRCAGGNPLTPPAETPVGGYRLEGKQWDEYRTKQVIRICPNDRRVETVDNKPMIVPISPPPGPDAEPLPGQGFLTLVDPLTGNTYGFYFQPEIDDLSLYPPLAETLPDPVRINVPFVPADEKQAQENGLARPGSPLPAEYLVAMASANQDVPQGAPESESSETTVSDESSTESSEPTPSDTSTEPSAEPSPSDVSTVTTTTTEPTVEQTTEQTTVETTQPTTEPTVEQTTQPQAVPDDTGAVTTTAPAS